MKSASSFTARLCRATSLVALAVLMVFGAIQAADASTAANTLIRNTVTVDYDDAAGNPQAQISDTADVTVTLVAATPTLNAPIDQTINSAQTAVYNYTITGNANGPDTYDLTESSLVESAGISGSTANFSVTSVTLGGTTLAAVTDGSATITVPYDGTSDGVVNGIAVGDTIDIDGVIYTVDVAGITETPGTNLATITLTANVPAGIAAGEIVGEQQSFTVTVDPGTVTSTSNQTIDLTISAQDQAAAAGAASDVTRTTVQVAALTVTKQVSTDGTNFVDSANAAPGTTLTYRITVTNGGAAAATNVEISDPVPQFTTYVADSAKADTATGTSYGAAATTLTDADNAGDDGYIFSGNTASYTVPTVSGGSSVLLFFQVTIN
jgi:uncharacterized repeat protein (TIGR01451 family)